MYRLRALIWKGYKLRFRSLGVSVLEIAGPIALLVVYLILKFSIGAFDSSDAQVGELPSSEPTLLDVKQQFPARHCARVLYHSELEDPPNFLRQVEQDCGIRLIKTSSREDLVSRLRRSLNSRIEIVQPGTNLYRSNTTNTDKLTCSTTNNGNQTNGADYYYQFGLVQTKKQWQFDVYSTDGVSVSALYEPYTPSSTYTEFNFAFSDLNSGAHLLNLCLVNVHASTLGPVANSTSSASFFSSWRIKSYPFVATPIGMPVIFLVLETWVYLFYVIAAATRVMNDKESGFHYYARTSGVSALAYWSSFAIIYSIHLAIQCIVLAMLTSLNLNDKLLDPIQATTITLRWMFFLAKSLSITAQVMFMASLFDRVATATLFLAMILIANCMTIMIFAIQWNPFGWVQIGWPFELLQVTSETAAMHLSSTIYAITIQNNQPTNWQNLGDTIIGAGQSFRSLGWVWAQLWLNSLIWFLLTVIADYLRFAPSWKPTSLVWALGDTLTCGWLEPRQVKPLVTPLDPNRLCCSVRDLSVRGPTVPMACTKGDPLRMREDQLKILDQFERQVSRSNQHYVVSRSASPRQSPPQSPSASRATPPPAPIVLDQAISQHIVWVEAKQELNSINFDMKYNQLSFVLGHTELRSLLFASLKGLRALDSGRVTIEGHQFRPHSIDCARPFIGYLGNNEVYFKELNIIENLQLFGRLRDPNYATYDSESNFVLSLLRLATRSHYMPGQLTHRSARKLALAVASVGRTKLLLLVEPTLGLRWKPRCQVLNLLKKYKSIRSILVDSSDIDEACAFGDRILFLRQNSIDLDGSPEMLGKQLMCGHWLVFEPVSNVSHNSANFNASLAKLEALTSQAFGQDKLDRLTSTKRSVYHKLMSGVGGKSTKSSLGDEPSKSKLAAYQADLHKPTIILKVSHSQMSTERLCSILSIFASHKAVEGFRLVELNYVSLEDAMVLRTSNAMYPDLPPDLLLSLRHRTMVGPSDPQDPMAPPVSVKRVSSTVGFPSDDRVASIYNSNCFKIIADRLTNLRELAKVLGLLVCALLLFALVLLLLVQSLKSRYQPGNSVDGLGTVPIDPLTDTAVNEHHSLVQFYRNRMALFVQADGATADDNSTTTISPNSTRSPPRSSYYKTAIASLSNATMMLTSNWLGNKAYTQVLPEGTNPFDDQYITKYVENNQDLPISLVVVNPKSRSVSVVFQPYEPHALVGSLKTVADFQVTLMTEGKQRESVSTSQRSFLMPWHEIFRGFYTRRLFYGLAFGVAESLAIAAIVIAPLRHLRESRGKYPSCCYLLSMCMVDLSIGFVHSLGYLALLQLLDGPRAASVCVVILLMLMLYKCSMLPFAYMISYMVPSVGRVIVYMLIVNLCNVWAFGINLHTFAEWVFSDKKVLLTILEWLLLLYPICSLGDAVTITSHMGRIDELCPLVPAYTATRNTAPLDGPYMPSILGKLLKKVQECLMNGKSGISVSVMHQHQTGILWHIALLALFGVSTMIMLLISQRPLTNLARRIGESVRTLKDPMRTMVRSPDSNSSRHRWDKERDRLISEYVRCMNELRYVKTMSRNCLLLRVWFKPMGDQTNFDGQVSRYVEPLIELGQARNSIQVELRTTLQMFIRIGNEFHPCTLDKVKIIQAYDKFVKANANFLTKFALVDWTRETLYKVLLHGHYNTKQSGCDLGAGDYTNHSYNNNNHPPGR